MVKSRMYPEISPIERQALELAAQGYSNKEISKQLHYSNSSTERITEGLRRKLGATNIVNAVHIATERGILWQCECGMELVRGRTLRNRLAWFCYNPACKWNNVAILAVYV